jgi:WD40 repeat protein
VIARFFLVILLAGLALAPACLRGGEPPPTEAGKAPEAVPAAGTDIYGDPLPNAVIARLGTLRVRDGTEGNPLAGHRGEVTSLAWSPDSRLIGSAGLDHAVRLWDPRTARCLHVLKGHTGEVQSLAFSPDGKLLASGSRNGAVALWDVPAGKLAFRTEGQASAVAFSPDGKVVASGGDSGKIRLWDTATGKERPGIGEDEKEIVGLAFSPDGSVLVSAHQGEQCVRLREAAGGRLLREIKTPSKILSLALSPDGRTLATGCQGHETILWETATGKERARVPGHGTQGTRGVAFSPDGKSIAFAQDTVIETVEVWGLTMQRGLGSFKGHEGPVRAIAFSPDGKRFVTGSRDGTALLWWTPRPVGGKATPRRDLSQRALDAAWADLGAEDGVQAYAAIRALMRCPQGTAFLREHLRPAVTATAPRIASLIEDLDSDEFVVREKASNELAKLGELAVPALRKRLEGKLSEDMRRRVETLLGEALRCPRALEVLEGIGTPEAQRFLAELAEGAPETPLTQEAKASLRRLARQPAPAP